MHRIRQCITPVAESVYTKLKDSDCARGRAARWKDGMSWDFVVMAMEGRGEIFGSSRAPPAPCPSMGPVRHPCEQQLRQASWTAIGHAGEAQRLAAASTWRLMPEADVGSLYCVTSHDTSHASGDVPITSLPHRKSGNSGGEESHLARPPSQLITFDMQAMPLHVPLPDCLGSAIYARNFWCVPSSGSASRPQHAS